MKKVELLKFAFGITCIFSLGAIACNTSDSACLKTDNDLFRENKLKLFVVDKFERTLRDKAIDSIKGGEYTFYKSGQLRSYKFFHNLEAYSYNEEYNSDGKIIKVEGKPFVFTNIKEVKKDSAFFKLYLFSLNKLYTNSIIQINRAARISVTPIDDSLYSNMSILQFGLNTKDFDDFVLYIEAGFLDLCNAQRGVVKDTLSLATDAGLHFVN